MANIDIHRERRGPLETDHMNMHALLSWRSIVAGLLVAFFTMIGLIGLGLAFGGIGMEDGTSFRAAGIFTGIWFTVSSLISLFVGSYFAARLSKFRTARIGAAQGVVIASLFLGFFLYQSVTAIETLGSAAGNLLQRSGSLVVQGAQQAAENQVIMNTINNLTEDALGDLNLKSEPRIVAQGLATRLLQGDIQGAQNFLVRQSDITQAEAESRIAALQTTLTNYVENVRKAAASTLRSLGWTLFLMVFLGGIFAIIGGALGSKINFRKPLIREESTGYYPPGHPA